MFFMCSRKTPPPFSIVNGNYFGKAPESLEVLNDIERGLVSRNRNTSHMFSFYAGQHQSIRGFHSLFKSNVNHTCESLRRMTDLSLPNSMSCVLTGPFTPAQKAQVMTRTTVNRTRLMSAFSFLHENNVRYRDLTLEGVDYEYPKPLYVDTSIAEEGTDDPRERIYEVTAFFPDGSEVTETAGGHGNANKFTLEYLQRNINSADETLLTSRPTREHAPDFAEDFLVDSFPLQFPYGIGGPKSTRKTKVSYFDMLKYYLRIADRNFMRHDFILLVHSLWEKEKAMTTAYIRAPLKMSNGESLAQRVGNLRTEDLIEEANIRINQRNRESFVQTPAKLFFDTIETSCKAMAHTNQASKLARRRMFSMWYSMCSPGIFFTVSPCDETNFRLRLYIGRAQVSLCRKLYFFLDSSLYCHNFLSLLKKIVCSICYRVSVGQTQIA
jgi:hypothetical protein